ncbi:hypothetical protein ACWCRD_11365 [Streptomyces sp. NPDC002092]
MAGPRRGADEARETAGQEFGERFGQASPDSLGGFTWTTDDR